MEPVSRYILITSFLMHTQMCGQFVWYVFATRKGVIIGFVLSQGIMYLLYPLCGWISDVYLSNFKAIKFSFFAALISSVMTYLTSLYSIFYPSTHASVVIFTLIAVLFGMLGLGLYEANAIQFALNQMVEASSEQLSSFVYWYIWCTNVAPLFMYYFSLGIVYPLNCLIEIDEINGARNFISLFININSSLALILLLFNLCFALQYQKFLHIEEIKRNPLKTVMQVLKYSYRHNQPEHRSAFCYYENKLPSRIDFGKSKYGGPFTYEQVEDVKTMFMLLLLILSLFGFNVSGGHGLSLSNFIMHSMGCPSIGPFVVLFLNPMHISLVLTSLGIPVYLFTRKYTARYIPSMISKLKAGLFLCLLNEALLCGYSLLIPEQTFDCSYLTEIIDFDSEPPLIMQCLMSNFKIIGNSNNTCVSVCSSVPINDPVLYLAFIPFILKGLSYLLVFVTALEFICAQAPNAINGFMIGIWYSMLCINYIGMDLVEILFQRANIITWNIYHGSKGLLIFLSIILFSLSSKHYHFRERNEIVNEQAIIEEIYERELLLNNNEQEDLYPHYPVISVEDYK